MTPTAAAALRQPERDAGAAVQRGPSDRGLLALLGVFVAAVLLIPDRYTVPLDERLGLRPYQLVVLAVTGLLAIRFVGGRHVIVGRPACVAGLLVVVAVGSTVSNLERLGEASFLGAVRVVVTTSLAVLLAIVVAAIATTPRRRRTLLGLLVSLVAVGAVFAMHESATKEPLRLHLMPPGLVEEADPAVPPGDTPSSIIRNGVVRPAGLAANPLELSAVMTLGLPFAVYLALSTRSWRARLWFLAGTLLISLGIVLSLSRTGVLASAVMVVVALALNVHRPRTVLIGLVAITVLVVAVGELVPQSVSSLTAQIHKDGNSDPSLATRLQDYEELDDLLGPYPWFGRGPDSLTTYVSRDGSSMILDNQYLLAIAETGVLGLAALLALLGSTAGAALRGARRSSDERGLYVAVLCATAAFAVMSATFDVLRFGQATSLFMIVVGLASTASVPASWDRRSAGVMEPRL